MTLKRHCFVHHFFVQYKYKGGDTMTRKQLAEILATFRKLEIENNPNLSHYEKELLKTFIDEVKKMVR